VGLSIRWLLLLICALEAVHDQLLRSEMKYKELSDETYKAYDYCRKELRKILEQDNLFIEQ